MYRCQIERTYSGDIPALTSVEDFTARNKVYSRCIGQPSEAKAIQDYRDSVKNGELPYFIFNTALADV